MKYLGHQLRRILKKLKSALTVSSSHAVSTLHCRRPIKYHVPATPPNYSEVNDGTNSVARWQNLIAVDCAPMPSTLAQSKERKGSNFAIWQPCGAAAVKNNLIPNRIINVGRERGGATPPLRRYRKPGWV